MSGGLQVLGISESDLTKMLAASTHLGSTNSETTMEQYIFKRRPDGVHIINLRKTWEKMMLAARAIAAIENPADVFVVSSRPLAQRAVLKFARYVGATPIAGRFTPGAFTNQIQAAFREPRLLVVSDPRADHQPITESAYVNIPVITLSNTDSPTKFVDIAIPCNIKAAHSVGLMWWFLAREVLRLRGTISRELEWEVMPDLFFYRDPDQADADSKEMERRDAQAQAPVAASKVEADWEEPPTNDWSNEPTPAGGMASVGAPVPAAASKMSYGVADDWAAQSAAPTDWATEAAPAAPAMAAAQTPQWGGSNQW